MTRASREQVEVVLMGWEDVDAEFVDAICRDWLDMQARERRLVAVVEAAVRGFQRSSKRYAATTIHSPLRQEETR
jgi:hypothetical protein